MSTDFPHHIAIRPLTIEDLEKVRELESLGFPPLERASTKTLEYRLKTCPELSSGLFIRTFKVDKYNLDIDEDGKAIHEEKDDEEDKAQTVEEDKKEDEDDYLPSKGSLIKEEKLIGHIIGTKIYGDFITEDSMQYPEEINEFNEKKGHIESSNTIGIHSLVIHPEYQKRNLATFLLHDYIQKLSNQEVGEKIAIIAKKELIPFYNRIGFVSQGVSKCKHGGEEWYDLHCSLAPEDEEED